MPSLRAIIKFVLLSVGGLLAVVIVAGLGLTLRLMSGPIDTGVPQSLLDRVVAEAAPGWRLQAGGAQLDFSSEDGLNGLKLHDVLLSDASGQQEIRAPMLGLRFALAASLDPAEALTVREVALTGASVDVTRARDGGLQLALGDTSTNNASSVGGGDPLASLGTLGNTAALPSLRIEDAQVRYTDQARGTTWRTEKAQLILTPTPTGLSGSLGLRIDGGIGEAQLEALHTSETGDVTATLTLNGVRPARVADLDPLLAPLARIDAPLSGTVTVEADEKGTVRQLTADVTAAPGHLTMRDEPTPLHAFAAALSCNAQAESCDLSRLSFETADASATARGTLHRDDTGQIALALTMSDASVRQGGLITDFANGLVEATFAPETGTVTVANTTLEALRLSGLPDGRTLDVTELRASGMIDTGAQILTLPALTATGIASSDETGTAHTLASATANLTIDLTKETAALTALEASDLFLSAPGLTAQIAGIEGGASATLTSGEITLTPTLLRDTHIERTGAAPSRIALATLEARVDPMAQTVTDGVFRIRDAILSLPELYTDPMPVDDLTARLAATHEDGTTRLALKTAQATLDGLPAKASGNFALRADGTALGKIEASLGPVALERVPQYWPLRVAPGGLSWVRQNVLRGQANSVTIRAAFDEAQPAKDTLDLRFGFSKAAVTFAPGMPPITGGTGEGHVTLDRFDLSLDGGAVDVPQAGQLALKGSSFTIEDFSPAIPSGQVRLRASGAVQSVLRLLDTHPLGVIAPTGFDIAKAEGRADVQVLLDLPLADDLRVDDVRFDARAKIHEYHLIEPETAMPVSGDLLLVKATQDGLTLQSDARIDGLAARMGFSQGFARPQAGEPESILTLDSLLSPADFARHGLDVGTYVEGLTGVKARIELFPGGAARVAADADLTNLTLKADRLGWTKPAGTPATMKLSGFRNANGAGRIEALALRGQGVSADGSIGFGTDGRINRANFSRVMLGSALDTAIVFGRKTNGDAGVLVEGALLDLRAAFGTAPNGNGEAAPKRTAGRGAQTDIDVRVGRVFLRDGLGVYDVKGGLRLHGDTLHAANVSGKVNGSAPAKLLAERRRDGLALRLTADDAGAFIRATDVFSGAYDGKLTLDAVARDTVSPPRISGRVLVTDMVVHDAPTLGRILSGGAIGSLMSDLANGGIRFAKVELPFRGIGSRWQIEDGVAYGPQIGVTLEGGYDVANGLLALNGSVSPAYAINGALGNVPLLGTLLTGGEGEGVFGVTFSVDGNSNAPVVAVNPLSALAPGLLRKIIAEVGKGGGTKPAMRQPSYGNDR